MTTQETIAALDRGELRVAEPEGDEWSVNADVQAAILDYFRERQMEPEEVGPFEYHDKIPLKSGYAELGVRVVPPARCTFAPICAPEPTVAHVSTIVFGPTHAPMFTYDGISTTPRERNAPKRAVAGGTTRTPSSA